MRPHSQANTKDHQNKVLPLIIIILELQALVVVVSAVSKNRIDQVGHSWNVGRTLISLGDRDRVVLAGEPSERFEALRTERFQALDPLRIAGEEFGLVEERPRHRTHKVHVV